jgi:hypothetical protein
VTKKVVEMSLCVHNFTYANSTIEIILVLEELLKEIAHGLKNFLSDDAAQVYFQLSSQIPTRRGKTGLPATFNQDVRS